MHYFLKAQFGKMAATGRFVAWARIGLIKDNCRWHAFAARRSSSILHPIPQQHSAFATTNRLHQKAAPMQDASIRFSAGAQQHPSSFQPGPPRIRFAAGESDTNKNTRSKPQVLNHFSFKRFMLSHTGKQRPESQ